MLNLIFYRNLLRRKTRSAITILGAAVGIAVYVSISSIAGNIKREVREVIAGYDSDLMIQARSAATPFSSRIRQEDMDGLLSIHKEITPIVVGSLRETWSQYSLIIGGTDQLILRAGITEGRKLLPNRNEVMIGAQLSKKINKGAGATIKLSDEEFQIVGVFGQGNRFIDGAVVMDINRAQRFFGLEQHVSLALLHVRGADDPNKVIEEINSRFPRLKVSPVNDFVANLRFIKSIEAFASAVGIISFFGACLVVKNTLLMAVTERTRELGILMAIGWSPILVLRMLLAESLALCFCGAITGNLLSLVILNALNRSAAVGFGWIPAEPSIVTVSYSLVIAFVMAMISMIWPLTVVIRLSPVEALRHE